MRNKREDLAADLAGATKSSAGSASAAPAFPTQDTMAQAAAIARRLPLLTSALQRSMRACAACRAAGETLLAACAGTGGGAGLQAALDACTEEQGKAKRLLEEAQASEDDRNVADVGGGPKRLSAFGHDGAW